MQLGWRLSASSEGIQADGVSERVSEERSPGGVQSTLRPPVSQPANEAALHAATSRPTDRYNWSESRGIELESS